MLWLSIVPVFHRILQVHAAKRADPGILLQPSSQALLMKEVPARRSLYPVSRIKAILAYAALRVLTFLEQRGSIRNCLYLLDQAWLRSHGRARPRVQEPMPVHPEDQGHQPEEEEHQQHPDGRLVDQVHLHKLVERGIRLLASPALQAQPGADGKKNRHEDDLVAVGPRLLLAICLALQDRQQKHGQQPPLQRLVARLLPVV
mmetsp:Transcript_10710/g.25600  ORF Transcript_10710/g.25600 Transcript_10710/m.25600 type:complete len:202 (-) Transcript_10710:357-962(-)